MWDLDLEIRAQLGRYIRGETGVGDFHRWFAPATWNVHKTGNARATDLAYRIGAALAEYSSGHITDRQLHARLAPLVDTYRVAYDQRVPDRRPTVGTNSEPLRSDRPLRLVDHA